MARIITRIRACYGCYYGWYHGMTMVAAMIIAMVAVMGWLLLLPWESEVIIMAMVMAERSDS